MDDPLVDKEMQKMIESGALEIYGIDEQSGEFLFRVTDKMKSVNSDFYGLHLDQVYSSVLYFWERGFVNVDDFSSEDPIITLTEKASSAKDIAGLPEDKQKELVCIISALMP